MCTISVMVIWQQWLTSGAHLQHCSCVTERHQTQDPPFRYCRRVGLLTHRFTHVCWGALCRDSMASSRTALPLMQWLGNSRAVPDYRSSALRSLTHTSSWTEAGLLHNSIAWCRVSAAQQMQTSVRHSVTTAPAWQHVCWAQPPSRCSPLGTTCNYKSLYKIHCKHSLGRNAAVGGLNSFGDWSGRPAQTEYSSLAESKLVFWAVAVA